MLDFGPVQDAGVATMVDATNRDPIVRAIAFLAPEVAFPKRFGSVCEVCRSVVKNPEAVEALRRNVNLFEPATNAVAAQLEKRAA